DRRFSGRVLMLDDKAHDLGRQADVRSLPLIGPAQTPLPVKDQNGWSAFELVGGRRRGQFGTRGDAIESDRENQSLLRNEFLKRLARLRILVFELSIEAKNEHLTRIKAFGKAAGLGKGVLQT